MFIHFIIRSKAAALKTLLDESTILSPCFWKSAADLMMPHSAVMPKFAIHPLLTLTNNVHADKEASLLDSLRERLARTCVSQSLGGASITRCAHVLVPDWGSMHLT